MGWQPQKKAGIQQELIPEAVGGKTEDVKLPEVLEQPQLSLMNYAAEAETFMGTCPDCSSQLESLPRAVGSARLRVQRVRVMA